MLSQHGGKKGKKIRAMPPPFRAMPERNQFFSGRCSLKNDSNGERFFISSDFEDFLENIFFLEYVVPHLHFITK